MKGMKVIASIDCGAAKSYTDGRGISWVSDSGLIKTGRVETIANATSFSDSMATLRVFPTGKRNCYTISVPTGGQFVLLRASFFYGNYDGKDSPPTFDIEFDGNRWATIQTSSDFVDIAEVIYIVSGSSIVFCVVQTNAGELPFVSAIELRALDDNMYSRFDRTAGAMVLFLRTAAGLAQPVRYPDDPYDRIWIPYQAPESLEVVQNQATSMLTNITDRPPAAILQAAVTPADGGTTIIMSSPLPSITVQAYINLYFTEVAELSIGQKRTLQVYIDNLPVSDPFVPPFGGVMEFYIANYSASSKTQIEVRPTTDSTLPTVISALSLTSSSLSVAVRQPAICRRVIQHQAI
ncbi:hypothetical protein HPP92_012090 [Vanilla planifolia]|uniref:Malectin-like domain-containing protein n=1 Tax=Vanilla planifolia TaxID=51239 RepID=A0A835R7A6_VANPL|nr:hypothetical protein HPP92_012090 [Vanilla planifolia]